MVSGRREKERERQTETDLARQRQRQTKTKTQGKKRHAGHMLEKIYNFNALPVPC